MRKILTYTALLVILILSGCSCDCGPNLNTDSDDNTTTVSSSVIIYGDACGASNGLTTTDPGTSLQVPNAQCDDWDGGSYQNRGRWVLVPGDATSASEGSSITVTVYGNMFYCSTGYENNINNPLPTLPVSTDIGGIQTTFTDGSQLSVEEGQFIVLNIGNPTVNGVAGLAIGTKDSSVVSKLPACNDSQYDDFLAGTCTESGGFGLSIYIDNKEVATMDNQIPTGDSFYNELTTSRYPTLYATTVASRPLTISSPQPSYSINSFSINALPTFFKLKL